MYTTSLPQTTIILFSGFLHQHQTTLRDDKGKSVQTTWLRLLYSSMQIGVEPVTLNHEFNALLRRPSLWGR